ncbi:PorT family protein [Flavobacterium alkalisoli]|uniref:OMP_b-brl_2 domain containing protein n=2 Tax=Flavobacterium TaxID=237 RepID=A0A444WD38_9FLAO|nr:MULTISPECIES: outer membrane beta-barrel protein [Flavobacterium]QEE48598.1 PorT family protein [Flavobacterium alkalisoli]RYJ43743.1 OMP_b-brl_2 domain containing protein [Flavobacterium beibuense]
MKKKLLFAFFMLGLFAASAQVTFKPGFRAGANFSRLTNTDLDTKTDFYVGAIGALKLTRFYTLQPEIGYSRQGAKGDLYFYDSYYGESYTENVDIKLEYVTLTLINKFTFNDAINFQVGPTFDIGTNVDNRYQNDVDLGITAGIGYTLPFGLSIEGRVKKGIADVLDTYYYSDGSNYYYEDHSNTNLVFQVGISYTFDVKGASN